MYQIKSKIIFITPSIKTGGGIRVFFELANQLCSNYEVKIVYSNNSKDKNTFELNKNIDLCPIGRFGNSKFRKVINIYYLLKKINSSYKNDIIIFTDPIFSLFSCFIKAKKKYRFIQADDYKIFDDGAVLGTGIILKIYKRLCKFSYGYKNIKWIFNSKYVYDKYTDISKKNVPYNLCHPSIDHKVFYPSNAMYKDCNICLVARKHPLKGLITFIDAYKKLPIDIKKQISNIYLISHDDLSSFDTNGMTIIKPINDIEIANCYRKSSIFISTSWWEGFGLPPLEAMACGCACIISDSGGVDEYAVSDVNCLKFKPKDQMALCNSIHKLVENSSLKNALQKEAINKAKSFSWEQSAIELINIIFSTK